jgi:hypothetical protein
LKNLEQHLSISQERSRKNVVVDALSRLDIDSLKIHEEEELTFISESENRISSNIEFPNTYCLDLQRTSKSQQTMIKRK